jgi:hypothetical protein
MILHHLERKEEGKGKKKPRKAGRKEDGGLKGNKRKKGKKEGRKENKIK